MAGVVRSGDADERDAGGFGAAGVVYGVAQIPDVLAGIVLLDQVQAVGRRLWIGDEFFGNKRVESDVTGVAAQSSVGLPFNAAGEDGQRGALSTDLRVNPLWASIVL